MGFCNYMIRSVVKTCVVTMLVFSSFVVGQDRTLEEIVVTARGVEESVREPEKYFNNKSMVIRTF